MKQIELIKGSNKKKEKESNIQVAICQYIKLRYPDVIFFCDIASGMNLGAKIGGMNTRLRSSRAIPDLFISEPKGGFNGMYLELKKESPYKKDGTLKSQKIRDKKTGITYDHLQEQLEMLNRLRKKGYFSDFGAGFDDSIKKIDLYMSM